MLSRSSLETEKTLKALSESFFNDDYGESGPKMGQT